jgi:hypothetical protein
MHRESEQYRLALIEGYRITLSRLEEQFTDRAINLEEMEAAVSEQLAKVRGGTDNRGIVAAQLEDGAGETACQARRDLAPHCGGAGSGYKRDKRIVHNLFTQSFATD